MSFFLRMSSTEETYTSAVSDAALYAPEKIMTRLSASRINVNYDHEECPAPT